MQFTKKSKQNNGDSRKSHLHSTYASRTQQEMSHFLGNVPANGNQIAGRMINERNFIAIFAVLHIKTRIDIICRKFPTQPDGAETFQGKTAH